MIHAEACVFTSADNNCCLKTNTVYSGVERLETDHMHMIEYNGKPEADKELQSTCTGSTSNMVWPVLTIYT